MNPVPQHSGAMAALWPLLAAAALSTALAWTLLAWRFPGVSPHLAAGGLLIVGANAGLAHMLYQRALRARSSTRFLLWGLGGGLVRTVLLVALLVACHGHLGPEAFAPLLVTVLTGYFTFMFFEILYLHLHTQPARGAL